MPEPQNLVAGIQEQCNRVRSIIPHYEAIGAAGSFGKMMLEASIKEGEDSIASGDILRMLSAFKSLEGCE